MIRQILGIEHSSVGEGGKGEEHDGNGVDQEKSQSWTCGTMSGLLLTANQVPSLGFRELRVEGAIELRIVEMLGAVVPYVVGEATRPYVRSRRHGADVSSAGVVKSSAKPAQSKSGLPYANEKETI